MISYAPGEDQSGPGAPEYWPVPQARGPVRAVVRLPGSKSMTNRALVLAALSDDVSLITCPLVARDTRLMADALGALGSRITEAGDAWQVEPALLGWSATPGDLASTSPGRATQDCIDIDAGNAGTVLRFLPPVAALTDADVRFRGDARISKRPVGPLLTALRTLGATVSDGGTGAVPFVVRGRGSVPGGTVTLDASSSSQLVSGLLLAAARFSAGAEIRHSGPPVPSVPHIEMTVRMLRSAGVDVRVGARTPASTGAGRFVIYSWRVMPGPISAARIDVEPDLSNAVPFLAAALVTGGEVTVAGWPTDSLQPVARIIELLRSMGADVQVDDAGLRASGAGTIHGIRADLSEVGELTPVLTALAALASSPSEFTGIGHLRRHESNRLAALSGEIGKLGGDVTELDDGLRIRPMPLHGSGVTFDSHDDHRLVMAAAVLGLVTHGVRLRNAATVGKTFPEFSQRWTQMLASE
jgi:3-phosphoshikimate 1-carboxyvinyltransferase